MPGVPPDAMNNLKRVFKGMFKRGKKNKQDYSTTPSSTQPPQSSMGRSTTVTSGSEAAPPQLPPIQNSSPLQSATDTSKPLPPTHPLSTGQHDRRQEAVPQKYDAQPGPPAPVVNVAGASDGADKAKEQETATAGEISPPGPASAVDGSRSGDISAVSAAGEDSSPQSPPKTDSGIEAPKTEETAVTESQPTETRENVQPNGTTTAAEDKPTTNGTPATEQTNTLNHIETHAQPEEKVAVTTEEPPPIKPVKAAPGMSATSGPLEDFPEGGDMRFD